MLLLDSSPRNFRHQVLRESFALFFLLVVTLVRQVAFSEFCGKKSENLCISDFFRSPSGLASPASLSMARKASTCMMNN